MYDMGDLVQLVNTSQGLIGRVVHIAFYENEIVYRIKLVKGGALIKCCESDLIKMKRYGGYNEQGK